MNKIKQWLLSPVGRQIYLWLQTPEQWQVEKATIPIPWSMRYLRHKRVRLQVDESIRTEPRDVLTWWDKRILYVPAVAIVVKPEKEQREQLKQHILE